MQHTEGRRPLTKEHQQKKGRTEVSQDCHAAKEMGKKLSKFINVLNVKLVYFIDADRVTYVQV